MAMILYFKEVDKLPPSTRTHWDLKQQKPVRIREEEYNEKAPRLVGAEVI